MSKRTINLITLLIVIVAVFFGYRYFFVTPDVSEVAGVSVVATAGSTSSNSFLNLLLSVKNLTLSKAVFDNPVFRDRLQDFGRELPDREVGRSNPFAPFGVGDNGVLVSGSGSAKATSTKATSTPASTTPTPTKVSTSTTKTKTTPAPTPKVDLKSLEEDLNQVDNLDSGADFTF